MKKFIFPALFMVGVFSISAQNDKTDLLAKPGSKSDC